MCQKQGSGPPHFDGKNYKMWQRRKAAFLRGKGQILWDVIVNTTYFHPINFLAPGSRDMFDASNQANRLPVLFSVSIRIRSGSDGGLGVQDLVGAEECSCWEC
jgi:hypothetical protein